MSRYFEEEDMLNHIKEIRYIGQMTNTPIALRVRFSSVCAIVIPDLVLKTLFTLGGRGDNPFLAEVSNT